MDLRARLSAWQQQLVSPRTRLMLAEAAQRWAKKVKRTWRVGLRMGREALGWASEGFGRTRQATTKRLHGATARLRAGSQDRQRRLHEMRLAARVTVWRRAGSRAAATAARSLKDHVVDAGSALRTHAIGARQSLAKSAPMQRAEASWRTSALRPRVEDVVQRLGLRRQTLAPEGRYRIEVATPHSRTLAICGLGLVALLVALPGFAGRDLLNDLIFVFTMLALAQYWNLLAGYAGLVSVGQQAFVGLGGYLLFALTLRWDVDPLAAILLAGVVTGLLALPTAFVVFRLRGAYFAIGTWVVAEVYRLVLAQFKQLGGGTGTSLPPTVTNQVAGIEWVKALFDVRASAARDILTYWIALALAVGTIVLVYRILRSRHGLALAAIRDSEAAAESVGVDIFKTKLSLYVIAAAATGMVGALIYLQKARISPDAAFSVLDWTAYVIFIVVIGGIGTIEGPIVGVLVFYVLQTNLAHFGSWYLMLLGLFAILVMLFAPKGIWGYLADRYGLELFPIRRRLVVSPPHQRDQ
jgi:branched-chain amino acid transport system permease protein